MKIQVISDKESLIAKRGKRYCALSLGLILVMIAAMTIGINRTASFEAERLAAVKSDKEVWLDQGERNPHIAAHFSRYVFKPIPTLSGFDPGAIDFAGIAVWLEAHIQNPTRFRRAESTGDLSRFVSLSPAWVMQVVIPLIVILLLFAAYAGEREDGTLRQVMSLGIAPKTIFYGKLRGASIALLKLLVPVFVLIAIAIFTFNSGSAQSDLYLRLFGIIATYTLYLFVFAMITIGVSALSSSRRNAAIAMLAIWCTVSIVMPRFANDVAVNIAPQPDSYQTWKDLVEIKAKYWGAIPAYGVPLTEHRKKVHADFLKRFNVTNPNEAPVPLSAWEQNASEEFANPLFDKYYGNLNQLYLQQESARFWLTAFSPTISVMALSSGFSGSDRLHHYDYVETAEKNRRQVVKELNEDLIYNSNGHGLGYTSSSDFWQSITDYQGKSPVLSQFISNYFPHIVVLLIWAVAAFLFARWAAFRAANMETIK